MDRFLWILGVQSACLFAILVEHFNATTGLAFLLVMMLVAVFCKQKKEKITNWDEE